MLIRVDPSAPEPLGDQVAASVRRAVVEGRAAPGDRLPPAREVATALGINLHTVLRGYQQLRDEGLVDLRRGRGAVLTARATGDRAELDRKAAEMVEVARRLGLGETEVLGAVRAAFR